MAPAATSRPIRKAISSSIPAGSLPVTVQVPPAATTPAASSGAKITWSVGISMTFQPITGEPSAATTLSCTANASSKSRGASASSVNAGAGPAAVRKPKAPAAIRPSTGGPPGCLQR